jgi:lysyl-tRNA synthetase class I
MKFEKIKNLDDSFRKLEKYLRSFSDIFSDMRDDLDGSRDVEYNVERYIDNLEKVIDDCIRYLHLPAYEDSRLTPAVIKAIKERLSCIKYWFEEMNTYAENHFVTDIKNVREDMKEIKEVLHKCFSVSNDLKDRMRNRE